MKPLCVCGHSEGVHAKVTVGLGAHCVSSDCPCVAFLPAEETRTGSTSLEPTLELTDDEVAGLGAQGGVRGRF